MATKKAAKKPAAAKPKKSAAAKPKKTSTPARPSTGAFGPDYVARFRAMVDELQTNREILVHQYRVRPPAPAADIAAVEAHLGARLAPALRSFYEAADGLELRWIHARHPDIATEKAGARGPTLTIDGVLGGDTIEHGIVNLLPIRQTFLDVDWEGGIWFSHQADDDPIEIDGGQVPSLEFHKSLRPFDVYSFYEMSALYCRPGHGDPPVLFGTDHGIDWSDSCEEKLASQGVPRGGGRLRTPLDRARPGAATRSVAAVPGQALAELQGRFRRGSRRSSRRRARGGGLRVRLRSSWRES